MKKQQCVVCCLDNIKRKIIYQKFRFQQQYYHGNSQTLIFLSNILCLCTWRILLKIWRHSSWHWLLKLLQATSLINCCHWKHVPAGGSDRPHQQWKSWIFSISCLITNSKTCWINDKCPSWALYNPTLCTRSSVCFWEFVLVTQRLRIHFVYAYVKLSDPSAGRQ